MTIRFDGRVAIVTGAGNGLGRAHALGLASRGAKVVVNDFGGTRDGTGGSLTPAETVVEEIRKAGGVAMADGADVSNYEQVKAMVDRATREWGSVDLLCANAGILRDKSFGKMEVMDFAKVLDVHLVGTFYCCKAVWEGMRERNYGRIVLTTSSSGLYGNFGQANYGAAKSGMVGLMNVLAEEGRKNNIRVNTISPTAATRMTEELLPPQALALMRPEAITPAVEYLLHEDAPTRTIMGAGAGSFAVIKIMETEGINLPPSEWTPDAIAAHFNEISDMSTAKALESAFQQTQKYVAQAAARAGVKLSACHSGARVSAGLESITTIGSMDSGPAQRGASRNDDVNKRSRHYRRRPVRADGGGSACARRGEGDRLRRDAVGGSQILDGRARRAQFDAQ